MDPVIADRCVIVALSDAFGGFQNSWIPPTPFALQGGVFLATLSAVAATVGPLYERGIRVSQRIRLNLAWFWLGASLPMVLVVLIEQTCRYGWPLAATNPLNPAYLMRFPLETVFAGEEFNGDGQFCVNIALPTSLPAALASDVGRISSDLSRLLPGCLTTAASALSVVGQRANVLRVVRLPDCESPGEDRCLVRA